MKRTISLVLASLAVFAIAVAVAEAASSPTVSTGTASSIRNTSAVLNGRVNPNGGSTHYWFIWGPTTAYGSTSAHHSAGSGTSSVAVHVGIGSLLPGTRYHFRLIAQNASGTTTGADHTFKTTGHPLPGVATGGASNVSATGAALNGTVLPNGQATSWFFQYSGGAPFVSTPGGAVKAGSGPTNVAQNIGPLAPGATYQYRLVGVHGSIANYGAFQLFSTFPLSRPWPPRFTQSTKPSRDRTKPFVFTTTGSLTPSSRFVAGAQCTGNVTVRYFIGKRQVHSATVGLLQDCTYQSTAIFTHTFAFKVGGKRPASEQLQVQVKFGGNGYIAPTKNARVGHVILG